MLPAHEAQLRCGRDVCDHSCSEQRQKQCVVLSTPVRLVPSVRSSVPVHYPCTPAGPEPFTEQQPFHCFAAAPASAPEAAQQSTVVAEPTAATVPSPVVLTPLPAAPPGQLMAPVGPKNESLVPALWALDR